MTFEQSEAMLRNTKLHASDIIEAHHIKKSLEMLDYLNEDLYEILMSFGMNIIVAVGFWLEWKHQKDNK